VRSLFSKEETSKANALMATKSIIALSFIIIPYLLVVIWRPENIWVLMALYVILGFGVTFVGTTVMHDSLHGSFSQKKWVNRLVGFSGVIIGVDPKMWQLQHNVLHHTYTNIDHADEDIASRYVLRFSPNQPIHWFHRYQHIYAPLFYSLMTIIWVTVKDYIKGITYYRKGLIKSKKALALSLLRVFLGKSLYYGLILALPIYLLPVSAGTVIGLFFLMHFVSGTLLSFIFQPAHVVPTSTFIEQEEPEVNEDFMVHQLKTTSNYGIKDQWVFWFTGGLNFQVEHHLFPSICHVHYPKIAKVVRQTAEEFGIPYHTEKTFGTAIASHFRMLYALGNQGR
jgi:linoleoyl-CoA desaturase